MRLKVVLSRSTLDLMWALSDPNRIWNPSEMPLCSNEAIIELDEEVIQALIDRFDSETLDDAIKGFLHETMDERKEESP